MLLAIGEIPHCPFYCWFSNQHDYDRPLKAIGISTVKLKHNSNAIKLRMRCESARQMELSVRALLLVGESRYQRQRWKAVEIGSSTSSDSNQASFPHIFFFCRFHRPSSRLRRLDPLAESPVATTAAAAAGTGDVMIMFIVITIISWILI